MIRARYRRADAAHSFVVVGHAEYSDKGNDIVCAGASSIVYALLGWLENNSEDLEYINADVHEGEVVIACEGGERTAAVFEAAAIGLAQLADNYPDHVEIEIIGIAD